MKHPFALVLFSVLFMSCSKENDAPKACIDVSGMSLANSTNSTSSRINYNEQMVTYGESYRLKDESLGTDGNIVSNQIPGVALQTGEGLNWNMSVNLDEISDAYDIAIENQCGDVKKLLQLNLRDKIPIMPGTKISRNSTRPLAAELAPENAPCGQPMFCRADIVLQSGSIKKSYVIIAGLSADDIVLSEFPTGTLGVHYALYSGPGGATSNRDFMSVEYDIHIELVDD